MFQSLASMEYRGEHPAIEKLERENAQLMAAIKEQGAMLQTYTSYAAAYGKQCDLIEKLAEALNCCRSFVKNGIALGYIRMPDVDCPDPAHDTPRVIYEALHCFEEWKK